MQETSARSQRKRRKPAGRKSSLPIALAGCIVIIGICIALYASVQNARPAYVSDISGINLNASDVVAATPGTPGYSTVISNNLTTLTGTLQGVGYISFSTSEFNSTVTGRNASYPQLIVSTIIQFSNNSAASRFSQGLSYGGGNASQPGGIFPANDTSTYTYLGSSTNITVVQSVIVLNESFINQQTGSEAIYEYAASFQYKNLVGVVSTNGYYAMPPSYSKLLAQKMFQNMVNRFGAG